MYLCVCTFVSNEHFTTDALYKPFSSFDQNIFYLSIETAALMSTQDRVFGRHRSYQQCKHLLTWKTLTSNAHWLTGKHVTTTARLCRWRNLQKPGEGNLILVKTLNFHAKISCWKPIFYLKCAWFPKPLPGVLRYPYGKTEVVNYSYQIWPITTISNHSDLQSK